VLSDQSCTASWISLFTSFQHRLQNRTDRFNALVLRAGVANWLVESALAVVQNEKHAQMQNLWKNSFKLISCDLQFALQCSSQLGDVVVNKGVL